MNNEDMTDYDRAFELLNKLDFEDGKYEITDALVDAMQWKEIQTIEKACELVRKMFGQEFPLTIDKTVEKFRTLMLNKK